MAFPKKYINFASPFIRILRKMYMKWVDFQWINVNILPQKIKNREC
jgi:hypothetical protein